MKRKGRKSKVAKASEEKTNGVKQREAENGDEQSEKEDLEAEEPEDKRRKSGKRKSASKKQQAPEEPEEDPQYEVEQVLGEKMINGVRHYLIRWKGYEPESDTWEPEPTLSCSELIAEFKSKQKKRGRPKSVKKKGKDGSKSGPEWSENENFEVERILDVYFKRNGEREFLVSWKGYPTSQNSWEPEENMDCKDLIKKFMEKVEKAKEIDQRELRVNRVHTDRLTLLSGDSGRRLSKRNQGRQRVHYHEAE